MTQIWTDRDGPREVHGYPGQREAPIQPYPAMGGTPNVTAEERDFAEFQQKIRATDGWVQRALNILAGTPEESKARACAQQYEAAKQALPDFEGKVAEVAAELSALESEAEFDDDSLDDEIADLQKKLKRAANTRSRLQAACLSAVSPIVGLGMKACDEEESPLDGEDQADDAEFLRLDTAVGVIKERKAKRQSQRRNIKSKRDFFRSR